MNGLLPTAYCEIHPASDREQHAGEQTPWARARGDVRFVIEVRAVVKGANGRRFDALARLADDMDRRRSRHVSHVVAMGPQPPA